MLRALCFVMLLGLASTPRAHGVDMLVFLNPGLFDQAPDGRITGPGGDMIYRIAAVSGVEVRIQVLPPARVMQTLVQQVGACVAGVPRLPDNESRLRWLGTLSSSSLMLYGRLDEKRRVNGVEDLRRASIVVQRSSLPASWLRERGLPMQEVRDTVTALRMLQARRVDYWLVNELVAQRTFRALGGELPARPLHSLGQIVTHLACHRDTAPADLERLRTAVEQLRRDGELVDFGVRP
ncbi:MAG: transporter substrate-binding domain-containing protein [Burkholderiales bacterium]|nr:MAG: transporter substrate-binding domain-containing protein [Burkholderiales bacterium]